MEYFLQQKLVEDKNFRRYLDNNSNYIKNLNRDPMYYRNFLKEMKEVYKERATDKLSDAINTIDIMSSILDTIK